MSLRKLSPETLRLHKGSSFVGVSTCFLCHDGKGRLYLAQRSQNARDEQGTWESGGGGLKWGVTALDNTLREIQEEYGVEPTNTVFLGYRDVLRQLDDGTPTHWVALDFAAQVDPNAVHINEPDMVDDAGWFTFDDLPSPLHSQMEFMLQKYRGDMENIWHQSPAKIRE
jgi:8-oxo-dGTP diphosphatase